MADPPVDPDDGDTGKGADRDAAPSTPRWVKVFGILAIVLVLLVGILLLTGGGSHGPGRHTGSGDVGGQTPPAGVTEPGGVGGHKPPAGGHEP